MLAAPGQAWLIFVAIPVGAMQGLFQPSLNGLMSNAVSDETQGELQGALTSINAVGTIMAPLIMTQLFFFFTHDKAPVFLPGAPFLFSAILVIGAIAIFIPVRRSLPPRSETTDNVG